MNANPIAAKWTRRGLLALLVLWGVVSVDYRPRMPDAPPQIVSAWQAQGPLQAGAARVELVPPFPTPIGGYHTRGSQPFEHVLDTPHVRALVLEAGGRKVALVSVEVVVLPAPVRAKVLAAVDALGLDEVVIAATHTHAGLGGYWDHALAPWIGLGPYDPRIEAFLVSRIAQALTGATERLRPARLGAAHLEASNFAFNRSTKDGEVDGRLTAARIDALDGTPVARLVVYAAHPTIVHRDAMWLSADWPGAMSAALEADGAVALFWQGAVGNATWGKRQGQMRWEERVVRYGEAIAADARGAIAAAGSGEADVDLATARVRVAVPPAEVDGAVWGPFEPLAANAMHWLAHPGFTEVGFVRAGPVTLATVPGEPVAELGIAWREVLGGAAVVGLADDYVGYVEVPDRVEREVGEAHRTYFGPRLAPVLLDGLRAAREAALGGSRAEAQGW